MRILSSCGALARVVSGTALLLAISAGAQADQVAQNKLSLSKIKIAMPFTVLIQRAGLEAAMRSGAFKAEGLEIEVIRFRSWTEPVQAIASDAAQIALGGGSLMRAVVGRKAPVRQIAMVSSRYPYSFYVKGDSGIKSIADLRGKTVQTVRVGETLDNVWKQILASVNLKMTDVKRVESFNGFGTLISGSANVANLSNVFIGKARKAGFVKILDYNDWRKKHGLEVRGGSNLGWGTSTKMLKEHPDTVKAFLRALAKATVRLRKDKAFAISVLTAKPYGLDPRSAAEAYDLHRNHWMVRLDKAAGDFDFDARMVEIAMKRPKGSIDINSVSATGPVAEVLRELKIKF